MKCKNCGAELEEGKLYCEKCGEEIKIVPEFDLDFENQINQTIVNIAQDVFSEPSETKTEEHLTDPTMEFQTDTTIEHELIEDFRDILPNKKLQLKKLSRKNLILFLSVLSAVILAVILGIQLFHHTTANSYESQYREAVNNASNGNYVEAVINMEKALSINPENTDAQYLLANYYYLSGNEKSAVLLLKDLILQNASNITDAYDTLISIYEENQQYLEIKNLLQTCTDEVVLSKYNQYNAEEPVFSQAQGEYDQVISITINSNQDGIIHYTTDGSKPSQSSLVYDNTPILLESGTHIIKAVFTNTYGIDSEITENKYVIKIEPPDAPQVNIESGEFSSPKLIEVIYSPDTKVYYTTDGTTPDADSSRYTEPLEMPVGISNFHFVAINDAGAASEIVQRSFQFTLENYLAPDVALQVLLNNLQVNGIILNQEGNVPDKLGRNTYAVHTAVLLNDVMYYIIYENYIDTTGRVHEAQSYYAIDATTGDPFYALKKGEGQYTLREF